MWDQEDCSAPLPSRQFRTEAQHGALFPDQPEYEFFHEAFGMINPGMQQKFESLVQNSFNTPKRGFIDWSAIPNLGASGYKLAIKNTVRKAVDKKLELQQFNKLEEGIESIIAGRRAEMMKHPNNPKSPVQQGHDGAIEIWSTELQTISNEKIKLLQRNG